MTADGQAQRFDLRQNRAATFVFFGVQGLAFSLLVSKVSVIQDQLHLDDGTLAILLAVVPVLAGVGSVLAGVAMRWTTSATVLRIAQPSVVAVLIVVPHTRNLWQAMPVLAVFGLAVGAADATMNMQACGLERRYGRSIILAFFGVWSAAAIVASLWGSLGSHEKWSLALTYTAAAVLGIAATLVAGPRLLKNLRDETIVKDAEGRTPQIPWKPMALLCVVMTLAYVGESSVSNAGSVYLTKGLKATDTLGGLVIGAYTLGQVMGRVRGDMLVQKLGGVKVVRAGAALCTVGFVVGRGRRRAVDGAGRVPDRRRGPVAAGPAGVRGRRPVRPDRLGRGRRADQRLQLPGLPARRAAGHGTLGRRAVLPRGPGRAHRDDRRDHRPGVRVRPPPQRRRDRHPGARLRGSGPYAGYVTRRRVGFGGGGRAGRAVGVISGVVTTLALVGGLSACGGGHDTSITTAPVGYGPVTEVVEAPASVTPKAQLTVGAAAAGSVAQLMVADGESVKAGQTLLRISSPQAQASLDQAKQADAAAAAQGSSHGHHTTIDFSRTQSQADSDARKAFDAAQQTADQISDQAVKQQILDQIASARNSYAAASADARTTIANFNNGLASATDVLGSLTGAERTQTAAAVAIAQKTVDALTVKAPIAGTVSLRSGQGGGGPSGVDVSSLLAQLGGAASQVAGLTGGLGSSSGGGSSTADDTVIAQGSPVQSGAPLLVLTDSSTLTLTAQVDETSILGVAPGQTASVQLDAVPDALYTGSVVSVDDQGEAASRGGVSYRVRLSLGPGTLGDGSPAPTPKPGMSAVADITVSQQAHVLAVPSAAVVHDGSQDTVWLVTRGVAHRHVVRLGAQADTVVEVASGLAAGDVIVTAGADKVHDGQKL